MMQLINEDIDDTKKRIGELVEILPRVYIIDNVLSQEECNNLIELADSHSWEPALVNDSLETDIRKSDRCMIDDPALAAMLWKRITLRFPIAKNNRGWEPVALNERLRFLRYHPDDYFKQHSDGCFVRSDSERSLMTCMLYLNETQAQAGGETHFYQGYDTRVATVIPKPGRCLLFAHQLVHESALLKSGLKFAIRTDVMFRKLMGGHFVVVGIART